MRNEWYYGWGVRLTPYGWMFNVSGLDAVELTFESGKRFRIGTDRPGEVIDAMRLHKPSLADAAGTIGYEILTSLGHRYKRDYKGAA